MIETAPTLPPAPVLELADVGVRAGARELLRGVSFAVQPREAFGLIGPSGVGKSTLLKCLNRLLDLTPQLRASGDEIGRAHV